MEAMKLIQIADLQCGLVLNRKKADAFGTEKKYYKRLNMRSLQENGCLNKSELDDYYSAEELDSQFLTQPSDIIVRLFMPLYPVLIREDEAGCVIPSQLAVFRLKEGPIVLPGYLRWYLSSTMVSDRLNLTENTQIQRSVKVGDLSQLQIPILPLEKQELIIHIHDTGVRREKLYRDLMDQESIYMNGLLQKTIRGMAE